MRMLDALLSVRYAVPVICASGALVLSACLTFLVRRWALRWGFLDIPGGHKAHLEPVPLGGGIAIVWAFSLVVCGGIGAVLLLRPDGFAWLPPWVWLHRGGVAAKAPSALAIVAGALVLHVMGLVDDFRPLSARSKFLVETLVAAAVVLGCGVRAAEFLGYWPSVVLTVLWIVGICNSVNLLDNTDGLCAGVVAIASAILAMAAASAGQIFVPALAWALAGASAGFLLFNFPPARIFMGDAGSLPIGFLLAVLTVLTTYYDPAKATRPFGVAAPLLILAIPLYDTGTVLYHRWRAGVGLFRPDRRHFSHRLLRRGLSTRFAVVTIYLATAATGISALLLPKADWPQAAALVLQCVCVLSIIAILESSRSDETCQV